ncbi:hypothetical protein T492DRAFT_865546 [Pavlovales sp. CCMP2436]|nr:hypothetical protein T492DRAFT_865546 [Pavlovales sp. CCMP2436]
MGDHADHTDHDKHDDHLSPPCGPALGAAAIVNIVTLLGVTAMSAPSMRQGFTAEEHAGHAGRRTLRALAEEEHEEHADKISDTDPHTCRRVLASVLIGDALHNFADEIFIGTAFLTCDPSVGRTVTVCTVAHKISQEIADFFLLTSAAGAKAQTVPQRFDLVLLHAVAKLVAKMGSMDATWTPAQLSTAVCDTLVAGGRLKATPAFIRNDREAKITKLFEQPG